MMLKGFVLPGSTPRREELVLEDGRGFCRGFVCWVVSMIARMDVSNQCLHNQHQKRP
jgi:hypothetical protein